MARRAENNLGKDGASLLAMRSHPHAPAAFAFGLVVGLGLAGVAILSMTPSRAIRSRRVTTERASFIDGVHPPNAAELDARPAEEVSTTVRLESEAVDMSTTSQRW